MAAQDAFIEGHGRLPVLIKTVRAWGFCRSQTWPSDRAGSQRQRVCWVRSASDGQRMCWRWAALWQRSISPPGDQNRPLRGHRRPPGPRAGVMARAAVAGGGFTGAQALSSRLCWHQLVLGDSQRLIQTAAALAAPQARGPQRYPL